jgi:hypothetical protein
MASLKRMTSGMAQLIPLSSGITRIGRAADCEFKLHSPVVSKLHAVVEYDGQQYTLKNESLNGTRVNGQRLAGISILQHGDRIQIGMELLIFLQQDDIDAESEDLHRPDTAEWADPEDSIRHPVYRPSTGAHRQPQEPSPIAEEKIRARISLKEQSLASLGITDSVKKLSQTLRFLNAVRQKDPLRMKQQIFESFYSFFPQISQIVVADSFSPDCRQFRISATDCRDGNSSALICDDVIYRVARETECLLVADQWRHVPGEKPRLSTMGRILLMCVPIGSVSESCGGVVQLLAEIPEVEFSIGDLERLAILAQLLTMVTPLRVQP